MLYGKTLTTIALLSGGLTLSLGDAHAQTPAAVGTYTLVQVNGQVLPAVTERDADCTEEVLAGTLTFEADGDWEFEYLERETCGTNVDEDQEREDGDCTFDGQTVRFSNDTEEFEPNDLDIDEFGVGVLSANVLMVTLEDGQTVLHFRR